MLLAEHRVLALERLQPLDLASRTRVDPPRSPPQHPLARLFPPPREHERMDIQSVGHRLHLHPGHTAELHRRQLEVHTVAVNLLRASRSAHSTPPSVS